MGNTPKSRDKLQNLHHIKVASVAYRNGVLPPLFSFSKLISPPLSSIHEQAPHHSLLQPYIKGSLLPPINFDVLKEKLGPS